MLEGLMQDDFPLTLHHVRRRMRDCHPAAQVATLTPEGTVRASFAEISERVDRLARALGRLGIEPGDRVGTFAWNNQRHFELYMAIPCVGAVLHTLNVRLFAEQLTYIVNHAEDRLIFLDDSLVPLMEALAPQLPGVEHFVLMGDGDAGSLPRVLRYEELLQEAGGGSFDYPEVHERQAAALCYTSGTTGNPKGVLYSHRSISLHSSATLMTDSLGLSRHDRALVVVPMFHANAWGIPHGAALAGADLVMPDRFLQAEPLARLIESERPTVMGCVPTIFADLLRYADEHDCDLSSLSNAACGGSAVPRQLMKDFQERHGVRIYQAWGMTETSPVATYSRPDAPEEEHEGDPGAASAAAQEDYWDDRARQGKPLPWVELRLVDDDGREVPWDGDSTGEIQIRGPWIAARYYNDDSGDPKFDSGWLRTGDIASANQRASIKITDRAKDDIKSGGEWISSVDLENELMAHPQIREAAVIAKPDERWAEGPLCCVLLSPGAPADPQELIELLRPRVAKWWLPDEFAFVAEVPKTSVGKFDKKVLRARLHEGALEGRVAVGAARSAADRGATDRGAADRGADRRRAPIGTSTPPRRPRALAPTPRWARRSACRPRGGRAVVGADEMNSPRAREQENGPAGGTGEKQSSIANRLCRRQGAVPSNGTPNPNTKEPREVRMTPTDCMVSSRPQTAVAATSGQVLESRRGAARARRSARRGLLAAPVALALMIPAAPALAQEPGTSGYKQTVPVQTTPEPKSGTAPAKETTTPKTTPKTTVEPTSTTPASTATAPSESKLPFTGLDLRWVLGAGLLLLAAGLSLRVVQRRSAR